MKMRFFVTLMLWIIGVVLIFVFPPMMSVVILVAIKLMTFLMLVCLVILGVKMFQSSKKK